MVVLLANPLCLLLPSAKVYTMIYLTDGFPHEPRQRSESAATHAALLRRPDEIRYSALGQADLRVPAPSGCTAAGSGHGESRLHNGGQCMYRVLRHEPDVEGRPEGFRF